MIDKLLNSKFIQKIKNTKHIEIFIVVIFVLLLLIIYFINFDDKKSSATISTTTNSNSNFINVDLLNTNTKNDYINISQNYKKNCEQELKTLIFNSLSIQPQINISLQNGEVILNFNDIEKVDYSSEELSVIANGNTLIINFEPKIDKVFITGTTDLNAHEKLTINEITKNYLNINYNQIFLY